MSPATQLSHLGAAIRQGTQHWAWRAIVLPFILIRVALLVTAGMAQTFPPSTDYNHVATERGWEFTPYRILDVWAHWDARWYMSIIEDGYSLRGDIHKVQSNVAYYPLYPYLVKALAAPFYALTHKRIVYILMGLLVSNAFFLSALYLLYKLILFISPDERLAERSILYYLVYPSGFIFSCLYSESTFLFFAVASFYAAKKDRWLLAGLLAAALSLTRPIGVAIILPLALIYLESIHWRWRNIRPDILWLGVAPLAFLGFMLWSAQITGDILGIFTIQSTWDKKFTWPWNTIFHPVWFTPGNTPIDQAAALLFLVLVALSLLKLPSWSYGVYSLLFIASPLFTGQILSMTRYTSVLFPCFIVLAKLGRNETLHKAILVLFFTIQIVFMAAWSRFYWAQ